MKATRKRMKDHRKAKLEKEEQAAKQLADLKSQ